MGSTKKKKKKKKNQSGEYTREDLNLSTVSAQTVRSSRLFHLRLSSGEEKKAVYEDGCLGGFYSIERVFFLVIICVTRIRKRRAHSENTNPRKTTLAVTYTLFTTYIDL